MKTVKDLKAGDRIVFEDPIDGIVVEEIEEVCSDGRFFCLLSLFRV